MKKIPSDMIAGLSYTHDKYGKFEIIKYESSIKVTITFRSTGYTCITRACHIRDMLVRDKKYTPTKFKIGTEYETNHGKLVITSYTNHDSVGIKFIDTGCEKVVRGDYITSGSITDYLRPTVYGVGYLGSDKSSMSKIEKLAHKTWSHMLERCYSKRWHLTKPTYANCKVCDEWKSLASFKEWFLINYPGNGKQYHLDKDIKIEGNKVYSPEACVFVTPAENSMHKNGTLRKYFVLTHKSHGIRYVRNLSEFAREMEIDPSGFSYLINDHNKSCHGWELIRSHETPYFLDATA